jgi:hypothetical protein
MGKSVFRRCLMKNSSTAIYGKMMNDFSTVGIVTALGSGFALAGYLEKPEFDSDGLTEAYG